jgi:hypothetical protein
MIGMGLACILRKKERELEADILRYLLGALPWIQRPHIQLDVGGVKVVTVALPASLKSIVQVACTLLHEI